MEVKVKTDREMSRKEGVGFPVGDSKGRSIDALPYSEDRLGKANVVLSKLEIVLEGKLEVRDPTTLDCANDDGTKDEVWL